MEFLLYSFESIITITIVISVNYRDKLIKLDIIYTVLILLTGSLPSTMTTKKNILNLLRRENLSVAQLCERLGVTRNAINVQLKQLEAEGLVRSVRVKRNGLLGKPAAIYQAAPHSEDVHSRAYQPFVSSLIATVSGRMGEDELMDVLQQAGRHLARQVGLPPAGSFDVRLKAATKVADSLGATTQILKEKNGVVVRNYSCPIGTLVRNEACACQILAGFFSEATGCTVIEQCQRDDRLVCQYFIESASDRFPAATDA